MKRKAQKNITMGEHPDRNAQFENIVQLKQTYRDGSLYTQAAIQTNDHDFPSSATGSVIPHGFYDLNGG